MSEEPVKIVVLGAGSPSLAQSLAALGREIQGQVVFLSKKEAEDQGLLPDPETITLREVPSIKAGGEYVLMPARTGKGERKRNKANRWG